MTRIDQLNKRVKDVLDKKRKKDLNSTKLVKDVADISKIFKNQISFDYKAFRKAIDVSVFDSNKDANAKFNIKINTKIDNIIGKINKDIKDFKETFKEDISNIKDNLKSIVSKNEKEKDKILERMNSDVNEFIEISKNIDETINTKLKAVNNEIGLKSAELETKLVDYVKKQGVPPHTIQSHLDTNAKGSQLNRLIAGDEKDFVDDLHRHDPATVIEQIKPLLTRPMVGGGLNLHVQEVDGSPDVSSVNTIEVNNGSLTNMGGGRVRIDTAAGAQGPQGDQGFQGNQGTQGNQGDAGPQGPQGDDGNQGNQGNDGAQGNQGNQGDDGAQGFQGNDGAKGDQGNQGNQGTQGAKGDQGDTGATGPQGNQGNQGDAGAQGNQGDTGAQGNQGNQGDQGDTGATGPQGNQGDDGAQGNQGNQGATGSQGNQGNQGDQGDDGAQGNQGNQGVAGPQGNQGNQGNQGVAGMTVCKQSGTITNNTTDLTNVTGLAFSLISGHLYYFKFVLKVQSSNSSIGARFAFSGPAVSHANWGFWIQQGAAGVSAEYMDCNTADITTVLGNASFAAANTDYICIIEGTVTPSENGTLQLRVASETGTYTITVNTNGMGYLVDAG